MRPGFITSFLQELWPLGGADKVYALVDVKADPRLFVAVERHRLPAACLYRGFSDPATWPSAPFLVQLEPESPLTELLAQAHGLGWGIFVCSPQTFQGLSEHLRRFLLVHVPGRGLRSLPYYRPAILRVWIGTPDAAQHQAFFAAVSSVICEGDAPGTLTTYRLREKTVVGRFFHLETGFVIDPVKDVKPSEDQLERFSLEPANEDEETAAWPEPANHPGFRIRASQFSALRDAIQESMVRRHDQGWLSFSHEQAEIVSRAEAYAVVETFCDRLRILHPEAVKDLNLHPLVAAGLRRGLRYGISWESSLFSFVELDLLHPGFDRSPAAAAILRNRSIDPNLRPERVKQSLLRTDWETEGEAVQGPIED